PVERRLGRGGKLTVLARISEHEHARLQQGPFAGPAGRSHAVAHTAARLAANRRLREAVGETEVLTREAPFVVTDEPRLFLVHQSKPGGVTDATFQPPCAPAEDLPVSRRDRQHQVKLVPRAPALLPAVRVVLTRVTQETLPARHAFPELFGECLQHRLR